MFITMDVEVIIESWGTYKLGDVIPGMPESTALACIAKGVVKEVGSEDPVSAEAQALIDQQTEADRLEKERLEKEQLEKEEQDRLAEEERIRKEQEAEEERLKQEEADRLEKEQKEAAEKETAKTESKTTKKQ